MIQYKYLVSTVNLQLNILCQLKQLELKQLMLENMILYVQGECNRRHFLK